MKKSGLPIIIIFLLFITLPLSPIFIGILPLAIYCKGLRRSIIDIAEIVTILGESRWYYILLIIGLFTFAYHLEKQVMVDEVVVYFSIHFSIRD